MIEFLKEENERNRQHEKRMMEMQMQIYQTMMATFRNQEQGQMAPLQQATFASPRQPQGYENLYMFDHNQSRGSENNYSRNNSTWVSYVNREDTI